MTQQTNRHIMEKARNIRCLICDVDGVLSDGKVYYTNSGEELKNFNIKDGLGIKLLMQHGIEVAIITGRESAIVNQRAKELGITHIYQNQKNKQQAYLQIQQNLNIGAQNIAHIGDDLPDLPLMKQSGLGFAVADAYSLLLQEADYTTRAKGGEGAVREVADLLLQAQGKLEQLLESYLTVPNSSD